MAVWNKAVSWSKFKLALGCQRQLQFILDKTPYSNMSRGWYAGVGKAIQQVFEVFYKRELFKDPRYHTPEVFDRLAIKVLATRCYDEGIVFDQALSREKLEVEVRGQVQSGRKFMEEAGLLTAPMVAENGWRASFRNLRLYGMFDFLRYHRDGSVSVYDGKGSQRPNADPRQILYYALVLIASGKRISDAALIYWKHGITRVDVSPEAIRKFVENDFNRGAAVFQRLKTGVPELPASPSNEMCRSCNWRTLCKDSVYYQPGKQQGLVTMGDEEF